LKKVVLEHSKIPFDLSVIEGLSTNGFLRDVKNPPEHINFI